MSAALSMMNFLLVETIKENQTDISVGLDIDQEYANKLINGDNC